MSQIKTNTKVNTVTKKDVKKKFEVKPPKHYQIHLLNNNRTSFEAVVDVLRVIFGKNQMQATAIMMHAHINERAMVEAPVTKEMGDAKIQQAREYCRRREAESDTNYGGGNGHNYNLLQFDLREED